MVNYRLYHIRDGHFFRAHDIKAGSDAEAVEQAQAWMGAETAELWCGERKVMVFPGSDEEGGNPA